MTLRSRTPERDARLIQMRAERAELPDIMAEFGLSRNTIYVWMRELGLPVTVTKPRRGEVRPKAVRCRTVRVAAAATKPPALPHVRKPALPRSGRDPLPPGDPVSWACVATEPEWWRFNG